MMLSRWSFLKKLWLHPEHDEDELQTNSANSVDAYARTVAFLDSEMEASVTSRRTPDFGVGFFCRAFHANAWPIMVMDL